MPDGIADYGTRLRQAATEAGILPSDVLAPVIELLAELPTVLQGGISDRQVGVLAGRLMSGCQAWSRSFLWTSYWRSGALWTLTLLIVLGVGLSVGRWSMEPAQGMICSDQSDGSRICYFYQRLATKH